MKAKKTKKERDLCEQFPPDSLNAVLGGLVCTRYKGHKGKHRAEGINQVGTRRGEPTYDPTKVVNLGEWD